MARPVVLFIFNSRSHGNLSKLLSEKVSLSGLSIFYMLMLTLGQNELGREGKV